MLQAQGSQEHGRCKADLQTTGLRPLIEIGESDEGSEAASCLQVRLLAGYKLGSQDDVPWLATELKCCTWADGCQPEQQVAQGIQGSTCSQAIKVHHILAEPICAARCAQTSPPAPAIRLPISGVRTAWMPCAAAGLPAAMLARSWAPACSRFGPPGRAA